MKNFKNTKFFKGATGYLSTVGMYGFWYPSHDYQTVILKDTEAEHLTHWRNQDPYFAFSVPAGCVQTISEGLRDDQLVCVWFHEEEILKNTLHLNETKEL
tara:strand:- start:7974 stop:8273 length:300 start_codon:yes stop_codon:yes gene_type:complete